jgi:predicted GIY-YIG superfamily endonuclease
MLTFIHLRSCSVMVISRERKKTNKRRRTNRTTIFRMYVLSSVDGKRTYVGVSKDLPRRLKQHNRQLSGGARTTAGRKWRIAAIVENFSSDAAALSVEKRMHVQGSKWLPISVDKRLWKSPLERRLCCLDATLRRTKSSHFRDGRAKLAILRL